MLRSAHAFAALLVLTAGWAVAQDSPHPAFTARDANLDELLEQAARLERAGNYERAVAVYLRLEEELDKLRSSDPGARPTTEVGPGIDRGVGLYLRDRIERLPADAQERYRLSIDPRAREAMQAALEQRLPEAIEGVIARYPLSSVVDEALPALGGLAMERGELGRAMRVYRQLEERVSDPPRQRKASLLRAYAAIARREGPAAREALAAYAKHGGDASAVRPFGPVERSLRQLVEELADAGRPDAGQAAGFDPGQLARTLPLAKPELSAELARALPSPPAGCLGVLDASRGLVYVSDAKGVRALAVDGRPGTGWSFSLMDEEALPSRVEVSITRPALGGGRVYATLDRNRPATLEVKQEGQEQQLVATRRKDWRVVALDQDAGTLAWDAANREPFAALSSEAEWVSSPLAFESGIYVTVLERENANLRASLVGLDAASGELRFKTFIAARSAYDHLGLGAPPPPPNATPDGQVLVSTGLGVTAAVETTRGDLAWVARYPVVPQSSEPTVVREERRFHASAPLAERAPVVVAPVDSVECLALDPRTGRVAWRSPRGQARFCLAGPQGKVLLLGRRLEVLDRDTGRVLARGPELPEPLVAPPALFGREALGATSRELVRLSLETGELLARYRFAEPLEEVGPALALGGDRLATVGYSRLNVYRSLGAVEREAQATLAGDPRLELVLGLVHAQRRDPYQALRHLQRAVRSGITQTDRLRAQAAAVELLAEEAAQRRAAGDLDGFAARAERIDYFLGALGVHADKPPSSQAELDLLAAAATTLRAYADLTAAREDPAEVRKAVAAYQRLLWAPPGTLAPLDRGGLVEVRSYARAQLRELVARRGQAVYAEFDAAAARALRSALETRDRVDLAQLLAHYPAAAVAGDARWALAGALEGSGLRAEAVLELERFVADHPVDPRRPEALARLALLCQRLQRFADARRHAEALLAGAPTASVRGEQGAPERPAAAFVARLREQLPGAGSPAAWAARDAAAGLRAPLGPLFRSMTELSQDGAELLALDAPGGCRDLYLLRRGERLELRRVPDGERVLEVSQAPAGNARAHPCLVGELLLVPFPDRVEAYRVGSGELAWRLALPRGPEEGRIGPTGLHALQVAADAAAVLTGSGELLGLDLARGEPRWRRSIPFRATGGLLVGGGRAFVYSTSPGVIAAYSLADGEPTWTFDPDPQRVRLADPKWLDAGAFVVVEDGQKLVAFDAATGVRRWTSAAEGDWILEVLPALDGSCIAVRTHGPGGAGLRVHDGRLGRELWRDDGSGAARAGAAPPVAGVRSTLDRLLIADGVLYSFRTTSGRAELWAQDLALGQQAWVWRMPVGSRATQAIASPSLVLVPRSGIIGQRATLSVLSRGTGELLESHSVPGRRLLGEGALVAAGTLVLATDRGVMHFGTLEPDALEAETVALARALQERPDDDVLRTRLAQRLERAGRRQAALDVLREGILGEGLRLGAFDRLFACMTAIAESRSEDDPLELSVQRMPRPPEVDGELSDWWRPWSAVEMRGPAFVQPIQQEPGLSPGRWTGEEDLSARLYMGWDEKNFYFALDVDDTNLRPYDSEAPNWIGDCLLIAIDCQGNGGEVVLGDDVLLSLALTLPKKKDDEEQQQDENERKPEGKYFVRRKEDNSGAIYEAAIPWETFAKNGASVDPQKGPRAEFSFGFNVILTDDDGERADETSERGGGPRGALKTLELTPSVLLHQEKSRLWQGYIPRRFARITLR